MRFRMFKYKLRQLFCKHDWDLLGEDNRYIDNLNNIVLVWKYKCDKCGKIKYVHKK